MVSAVSITGVRVSAVSFTGVRLSAVPITLLDLVSIGSSPQVYCFSASSLAFGTIFRGCRILRRWSLTHGSKS